MIAMPYQTTTVGSALTTKVENVRNDRPEGHLHSPGPNLERNGIVPISSPSNSNLVENEDGIDDDGEGSDEGSSRGKGSKKIRKPRTIYREKGRTSDQVYHLVRFRTNDWLCCYDRL